MIAVKVKRQYIYAAVLAGLLVVSWKMGAPGSPPPAKVFSLPKIEGSIAGISDDKMPPTSRFGSNHRQVAKGDTLVGEASDLGTGVAQVAVQIQRLKDGAVWNKESWNESLGSAFPAKLSGSNFEFTIPVDLVSGEKYIFRSQAIDYAGNVQTQWSEIEIIGSLSGEVKHN